jgi:hypothetical protein
MAYSFLAQPIAGNLYGERQSSSPAALPRQTRTAGGQVTLQHTPCPSTCFVNSANSKSQNDFIESKSILICSGDKLIR